ncbi:MAG: hypothetical protein IPM97_05610 [Bdellovibrionaceae bacterium]|nr:hypothetical protein [Pseudobdellovibrionaceae bacterium]
MSNRLNVKELHECFLHDLEDRVVSYSSKENKPLDVDLRKPMSDLKVYLFNLTKPPGGRSESEYKIQLIIPGQPRGEKGNFDLTNEERIVILAGYDSFFCVWVLWDAYLYRDFSYSRNVQVQAYALIKAVTSGIGQQERETKNGTETVITCSRRNLVLGLQMRISMWARETVKRA